MIFGFGRPKPKNADILRHVRNSNLDGRSNIAEASKKVSILRFWQPKPKNAYFTFEN